jgi:hypothetical protein
MLLSVAEKPGQDYSLLDELYGNLVGQWGRYNGHVAAIVGSAETQEKYGTGRRFDPTPSQRQEAAVRFLGENAFRVPAFLLNDEVLFRIQADGQVARIRQAQAGVINTLFNEARLNRLIEYEALLPAGRAFTIANLLASTRTAAWSELAASRVTIDVYRRNLQRAYMESIERLITPPAADAAGAAAGPGGAATPRFNSDIRPAMRGHLVDLRAAANDALPRAANDMTRLHLRDVVMEIDRLLAIDRR